MELEIYDLVKKVLHYGGEFDRLNNPFRVFNVYEDDKVFVDGLIPESPKPSDYQTVHVALKIITSSGGRVKDFGLPSPSYNNLTVVYKWREGYVSFFRPGRWIVYLKQLAERFESEVLEYEKLHRVPIDDGSLFSDIPDSE